jgi:hypothetical protein
LAVPLVLLDRLELRLLLLLLVCYVYFFPRYADWSQSSRAALILAIVNERRLEIDSYASTTGDYAELNGHRYSDKAPGPALLGVPAYWVTKTLFASPGGQRLLDRLAQGEVLRQTLKPGEAARDKVEFALAQTVATWAVVSVPAAILGVLLFRLLRLVTGRTLLALIVTLAYALATSAFPYAGALYSHQLVAALQLGSLYLLWQAPRPGTRRLLTVGLCFGLAVISEYSTALLAGGLGLYALWTTRRILTAIYIAVGAVPPLAVMAVHNLLIFGTPLPVGYAYSTLWQSEHQTGFFSLAAPTAEAFWGITFSLYRGLFFISPVLLFGIGGLVMMARRRELRAEAILAGWCVASFFLFNSASVMWSGGHAVGPRYLVPMLPFLMLGVGAAVSHWYDRLVFRAVFWAALIWSAAVTWSLTIAGQSFPTYDQNPLINLALPALADGNIARNLGMLVGLSGWWSVLLLLVVGVLLMPRPQHAAGRMQLTSGTSGMAAHSTHEDVAQSEGRTAAVGV